MDLDLFFGRFHSLVVHLPIGFIFLVIFFELYYGFLKKELNNKLVVLSWFFCFLSSLFSSITGFLLSSRGHYIDENLLIHKIFGFILVGISLLSWLGRTSFLKFQLNFRNKSILNTAVIILLLITGHLGGNLTHGNEYLTEFSPIQIKNSEVDNQNIDKNIDSIYIYKDLVSPIFDSKCISCHNKEIKRGELDMSSLVSLLKGGNSGKILDKTNPNQSELFKRITLPQENIKFMPSDGEPTSYYEKNLILWWIENLSESDQLIKPSEVSDEMKFIFNHLYALDFEQKSWDKRLKVKKINLKEFEQFNLDNFEIKFISKERKYVSVKYLKTNISINDFKDLEKIGDHIVYFSLSKDQLDNSMIKKLLNFKNLVRLDLENNSINDDGIKVLSVLENLEVLNLIGTNVTENSFDDFEKFKNLKRIYLWKTAIKKNLIKLFNQKQDKVKLIGSIN